MLVSAWEKKHRARNPRGVQGLSWKVIRGRTETLTLQTSGPFEQMKPRRKRHDHPYQARRLRTHGAEDDVYGCDISEDAMRLFALASSPPFRRSVGRGLGWGGV